MLVSSKYSSRPSGLLGKDEIENRAPNNPSAYNLPIRFVVGMLCLTTV